MDFETIKSYLVALGAHVDENQFKKFFDKLDQAGKAVEKHTEGMAKNYAKAGTAIVGALASVTLATAGLMDKVAQSDLSFQLYAMKMYLPVDTAKKLKIAVDALGHSFEEIAWNPELNKRYRDLINLQSQIMAAMPEGFEKSMRSIRDTGFEFTKLKVIAEYGLQMIGYHLTKYLAGPMGKLQDTLKKLSKWLVDHLDEWTAKIARGLAMIVQLFGDLVRFGGWALSLLERFWSSLSKGQKAIVALAVAFELLSLTGPLGIAFAAISVFILLLDDFYGYIDGRKSSKDLAPIWFKLRDVLEQISRYSRITMLAFETWNKMGGIMHVFSGSKENAKLAEEFNKQIKEILSAPLPSASGPPVPIAERPPGAPAKAAPAGIAAQESGGNYYAVNPQSGAMGKYQIMPTNWPEWAAAAGIGANAPMTPENQEAVFKSRMGYYMTKYGDERLAAAAWYGGESAANRLQKGDLSILATLPRKGWAGPDIGEYIASVMGKGAGAYTQPSVPPNVTVTTTLGDINVNVAGTKASADEIAKKVRDEVDAMLSKRQQRLSFEMNGVLG
jgi:hypothetical protein